MFFTVLWNGMLLPFVAGAIMSGELMMLLGISLHLIVGMSLLYYVMTILINTTYVTIDEKILSIEHRPLKLPFYGDTEVSSKDVDQVFVKKYESSRTNDVPNYAYSVNAILKDKDEIQLLKGLKHADQAQYIEQEIEFFLKIDDKPVPGEWKGWTKNEWNEEN